MTVTQTSPRTPGDLMRVAAPALLAALLVVAACGAAPITPEGQPTAPVGPELPTAAPTSAPAPTEAASPSEAAAANARAQNARGNLPKQLGEPAYTVGPGSFPDDIRVEFRVDAIRQGEDCQSGFTDDAAANGQYLAVDVTAATTAAFTPGEDDGFFLGNFGDWSIVTADGQRLSGDGGNSSLCSPPSASELIDLTPAISVQGTILLDVPADLTGAVLVLRPATLPAGGWEWQIP